MYSYHCLFLASVLLLIKIQIINSQVTVTSFNLLWRGIYNDMHGNFVYLSPSYVLNLLYILWQAQNYENGSGQFYYASNKNKQPAVHCTSAHIWVNVL